MNIAKIIFGDPNKRLVKRLGDVVTAINNAESRLSELTDEQLKQQTAHFRKQLAEGKTLDDVLPEAFAAVREAARRTLGMRHFDVQLIGGMVLHRGMIAEMKTGEGKTLVATLPLYLNALEGKGAHLVTVNDYLSRRDCGWMSPVYDALGMTCGVIIHEAAYVYDPAYSDESSTDDRLRHLKPVSRKEAYAADITYGTNNEFGFDYLRDNMVQDVGQMVQRDLHYAIVDEVDSILIDEARTPLIISAPDMESTDKYYHFAKLVTQLKENEDYNVDEKMRATTLTQEGISKLEKALGVDNIYTERGIGDVHHIEQALRAYALFKRDRDYVVKDGEVIIIDEFTGRMMQGRRYSEGLHQAIEAKEGVNVQRESKTLATITFQNYFRLFTKLAGMTGTAETEAEEFAKIYNLEVVPIPTNRPMSRIDAPDRIFRTEVGKFKAVVAEVKKRHELGQPILIGTISIEKSQILAEMLSREGIEVHTLNAKFHEKEAEIIAQAGRIGAVTVATNMAGRGVDIKLGGDPVDPDEQKRIFDVGGLCIIGTERHESRRIDNQLRGRAGRQGDPGHTQFYVSTDDDLLRIFGPGRDRMRRVLEAFKVPEEEPIESKMLSRMLEAAQKKVEGHYFDSRKHLVEYDDVMNRQRETIYRKRREALVHESLKPELLQYIQDEIRQVVTAHTHHDDETTWNLEEVYEVINTIFPLPAGARLNFDAIRQQAGNDVADKGSREMLVGYLFKLAVEAYNAFEGDATATTGSDTAVRSIEKAVLLRSIDTLWIEHLETINHLRRGIGLRGYGQRDPLIEYKKESYVLFKQLLDAIQNQVVYSIFKVGIVQNLPQRQTHGAMEFSAPSKVTDGPHSALSAFDGQVTPQALETVRRVITPLVSNDKNHFEGQKVGRNEPCPCGSGKKYKQCHGK